MNKFNWLKAVQLGLIASVIGVLIALVGMLEEFDQRDIIAGTVTMGRTITS